MSSMISVYVRPWIDWAKGLVIGAASLTLTFRNGAFLVVAFLVVCLALLVGSHLWSVAIYQVEV